MATVVAHHTARSREHHPVSGRQQVPEPEEGDDSGLLPVRERVLDVLGRNRPLLRGHRRSDDHGNLVEDRLAGLQLSELGVNLGGEGAVDQQHVGLARLRATKRVTRQLGVERDLDPVADGRDGLGALDTLAH